MLTNLWKEGHCFKGDRGQWEVPLETINLKGFFQNKETNHPNIIYLINQLISMPHNISPILILPSTLFSTADCLPIFHGADPHFTLLHLNTSINNF